MKFCGNCGQQLDDNATFCTNCNAVIGEPAAYQYAAQEPVQQPVQPQQPVYIPEPSAAPYGAAPAPANDDPYQRNSQRLLVSWLLLRHSRSYTLLCYEEFQAPPCKECTQRLHSRSYSLRCGYRYLCYYSNYRRFVNDVKSDLKKQTGIVNCNPIRLLFYYNIVRRNYEISCCYRSALFR